MGEHELTTERKIALIATCALPFRQKYLAVRRLELMPGSNRQEIRHRLLAVRRVPQHN